MSRPMSSYAGKLFSLITSLALFLLFFVINLSAQQSPYIKLIKLKEIYSQEIQLPQACLHDVRSEQAQVKKSQSKPARSIEENWIQLKQSQLPEVQFKLTQAELFESEQIQSQPKQEEPSQLNPSRDQQNQSVQSQLQQAQSQRTKSQQAQSQQIPNRPSQSQQIQAEKTQAPQTEKQTQAPRQVHFYNVDSERKIEGTIQEILLEPRYEERQPFLMIVIKEKTTGEIYKVEVSPAWFFNYDLHKGEAIKIVGSYYSQNNENYLIARELQVGGETFRVRDRRGFPNWRGGPMKGKVRRIRGK